jgi:hypothetical protein
MTLATVAVVAFWMAQSGVALADNCSGVNDCLNSDSAAIWIGLAAFMLMLLDVGWHLIPFTGLLDSFLGYNVITWEPLSPGGRLLGILTPDGQIIHHGSDGSVFPPPGGGSGDHLQITGGNTYGGTGTLEIHLGTAQSDTVILSTDGPLQSGDSMTIEIRTDGSGPTGGV